MPGPLHRKMSSVLAVGLVLAHVVPVAAGWLVCIGDGSNADCCVEVSASGLRTGVATQYLDRSDCDCCVTVEAASNRADATSQRNSDDVSFETGMSRSAVSPTAVWNASESGDDPGNRGLASLRTVILLI